jgi:hypothetical protein
MDIRWEEGLFARVNVGHGFASSFDSEEHSEVRSELRRRGWIEIAVTSFTSN